MRRALAVLPLAAALFATTAAFAPAAQAAAPATPASFSAVTAAPGPGVGQVTFKWTQSGKNTTGFVLRTALSTWSDTSSTMARTGRQQKSTNISKNVRSLTLTAAQVAAVGAPVGSGNALYFRFAAVNKSSSGATTTRNYGPLQAVLPEPKTPLAENNRLRLASFNVRTARATTDSRSWLQRAPDVAGQIVQYNPGVVAMQELGPGRADGKTGTLQGNIRQTDSFLSALDKADGSKYDLVRTTAYVSSTTTSGTQGARILYDNTRFKLLSSCPETTGKSGYNSSCSIQLPILSSDGENIRRRAAFAEFENILTGANFFVVSVHLDDRHTTNNTTEAKYDGLRKLQVDTITTAINKLNSSGAPVMIAGDYNSWQNNRVGNSPHDTLVSQGYYDMSAAVERSNFRYATINHFETTLAPAAQGIGVRIDMIMVKGAAGASLFANVMNVTDSSRPSDHNMIFSDFNPYKRLS